MNFSTEILIAGYLMSPVQLANSILIYIYIVYVTNDNASLHNHFKGFGKDPF